MDFIKKKSSHKCEFCKFDKMTYKSDKFEHKKGSKILVVFTTYPFQQITDKIIDILNLYLKSYDITSLTNCQSYKSPSYAEQKYCTPTLDISKYAVVLAIGQSVHYFTKGKDVTSWSDFKEYLFNPTYFYYQGKRIYPLPFESDIVNPNGFKQYFAKIQFKKANEFLGDTTEWRLIDTPYNIEIVKDTEIFFAENMNQKLVAWDTETNGLYPFAHDFKCGCVTMSFDGITGYYLPMNKINSRSLNNFFKGKFQITANGKFDLHVLSRYRITECKVDEDVTLLYHILNTDRKSNSIKVLAWLVNLGGYDSDLDDYIKKYKVKNYLDIPDYLLQKYATIDAIVTMRLYLYAMETLVPLQQEVYDSYYKSIIPVIEVFRQGERKGFDVNRKSLIQLQKQLEDRAIEQESIIQSLAPYNFQVSSNEQIGRVLEEMGLPAPIEGLTKKGVYKTGVKNLENWRQKGYLIADAILEYRKVQKLLSGFVGERNNNSHNLFITESDGKINAGMWQFLTKFDKIHPTFSAGRTQSWRASSQNPNFQNIPKRGDNAKLFRQIFVPPSSDFLICEADYSGFQLRIGAIYSGDSNMKDAFLNKGGDLHSMTAQGVFKRDVTLEEFIKNKSKKGFKEYRGKAKCFIEGTLIKTNQGDLPIEKFVPEVNLHSFTPFLNTNLKLIDRHNKQKSIHSTYFGYSSEFIEIELDNGEVLEFTVDHELPVRRQGVEIKVKCSDLLETDEIITVD